MTAAAKYVPHYTVADYERWEGLWELWQGVPYYLLVEPLSEPSAPLVEVLQLELQAFRPFPAYVERGFTLHADCTIRPQLFAAEA